MAIVCEKRRKGGPVEADFVESYKGITTYFPQFFPSSSFPSFVVQ